MNNDLKKKYTMPNTSKTKLHTHNNSSGMLSSVGIHDVRDDTLYAMNVQHNRDGMLTPLETSEQNSQRRLFKNPKEYIDKLSSINVYAKKNFVPNAIPWAGKPKQ